MDLKGGSKKEEKIRQKNKVVHGKYMRVLGTCSVEP